MTQSEVRIFTLPDVGEGLTEARVDGYLVEVGETVSNLQPVVEVETDKSVVELTSPWAGKITKLLAQPDDWVDVGGPLLEIEVDASQ